jgi:acyl transferase domain-containing protein
MSGQQIAVLFPGQGVLDTGAFQTYQAACPEMVAMLEEVDQVARRFWRTPLTKALSRRGHPSAALDLLIFLAAVVGYKRLQREGVRPRALIGHGFGEIAALVAADALSLRHGAEIVAHRFIALASSNARNAMAAVRVSPSNVKTFLRILNDTGLSVAVENSSTESVIVGSPAGIVAAEDLARLLGIPFQRLRTTCGPHQASMTGLPENLLRSVAHIPRRTPSTPVYSPLRSRLYRPDDDVVECVVKQLVQPVRFADAVRHLVADGVALLIECGPLRGLAAQLDCAAIADVEFRGSEGHETGREDAHRSSPRLEVA